MQPLCHEKDISGLLFLGEWQANFRWIFGAKIQNKEFHVNQNERWGEI